MSENKFNVNGVEYVAIDDGGETCVGCAFRHKPECGEGYYHLVPRCDSSGRNDSMDVIFVEAQDERVKG